MTTVADWVLKIKYLSFTGMTYKKCVLLTWNFHRDMTFVVHWALKNNDLSILLTLHPERTGIIILQFMNLSVYALHVPYWNLIRTWPMKWYEQPHWLKKKCY